MSYACDNPENAGMSENCHSCFANGNSDLTHGLNFILNITYSSCLKGHSQPQQSANTSNKEKNDEQ